jgi:hypothetical protein
MLVLTQLKMLLRSPSVAALATLGRKHHASFLSMPGALPLTNRS